MVGSLYITRSQPEIVRDQIIFPNRRRKQYLHQRKIYSPEVSHILFLQSFRQCSNWNDEFLIWRHQRDQTGLKPRSLTKTIYDQKQFLSSLIYGNLFKQKNELIIQISIIATESWANLQDSSSENQCFAIAQIVLNASKDT